MSIEVQQFQTLGDNPSTPEQLQKAYASLQAKYTKILTQYNSYKESSISSYEKMLKQMEKNKSHNQQLFKKLQKKYENLLHQERAKALKNIDKLRQEFEKQRLNFRQIINGKNEAIENLSELLHNSEQQKSQIVEENTQNLINIVKSEQNCLQSKKYSHTQLMKMYQFLLEQNNCLKKQLLKVHETRQRSLEKTRKNKNSTQILYTDQSEKIQSMYISNQNISQLSKKKVKSKQNSQSINLNISGINELSVVKENSSYKSKTDQNSRKNKSNVSYHANISTIVQSQNAQKRKQIKKPPNSSQNLKKSYK